jgi:protein-S-isoprenylcysteine O-methyltransferase Ste14
MNLHFVRAILILPGTALVYIPALILWLSRETPLAARFPPAPLAWVAGLALAAAGLALMLWTMRLFATRGGGGTPAPWQPVRNFIVAGPYRHVRNPMLIGVILFQLAEATLAQSLPLLAWAATFFALNTAYFALSEEPRLERRFGRPYADYRRAVPRWALLTGPMSEASSTAIRARGEWP